MHFLVGATIGYLRIKSSEIPMDANTRATKSLPSSKLNLKNATCTRFLKRSPSNTISIFADTNLIYSNKEKSTGVLKYF